MTQDSDTATASSPYPRENHWGAEETDERSSGHEIGDRDPNDPAERVAFQLLRESAAILCARSLEEADEEIELTDPCLYIGRSGSEQSKPGEYGQQPRRRRYNPETGYISGGETTATVVADRPESEFLQIVDAWLEYLGHRLPAAHRDRLRQRALRLKRAGDLSDVTIMTKLVRCVRDEDIPE